MAPVDGDGRQPIVNPRTVLATGLASALAAFLTSRFGIAGTIAGTAISVMILTAVASAIEVYLETVANRARVLPRGFRARLAGGKAELPVADTATGVPRSFFGRFRSLPASRRRSVVAGGSITLLASFLIGTGAVTGVEMSAGRSLSCWLWDECPAPPARQEPISGAKTRPSILGGQHVETTTGADGSARPDREPAATPETAPGTQPASTLTPGPASVDPRLPANIPESRGGRAPGERQVPAAPEASSGAPEVPTLPGKPSTSVRERNNSLESGMDPGFRPRFDSPADAGPAHQRVRAQQTSPRLGQ